MEKCETSTALTLVVSYIGVKGPTVAETPTTAKGFTNWVITRIILIFAQYSNSFTNTHNEN